ncbi:MAG: signal peptide peptidase SppA [Chlorobi bacterium]|nr:signal peptide peptidase SppA [Chlorobiota bacterium]
MNNSTKWILGIFAGFLGLAILIFAVAIFMFTAAVSGSFRGAFDEDEEITGSGSGAVAVIELMTPITSPDKFVSLCKRYRKRSSVKAIVVRINSPGGAVAPSQEMYEELRKTREVKPVVISMSSVAASGGYYVALGGTRILANPGTITGSIGVVSQFINTGELMKKIGVSQTTIKSGKFKDLGNPWRRMTEAEKEYWQRTINEVYSQFVKAVARERAIDEDSVRRIADGRVYTGSQAVSIGLIDSLGTYEDAIALAAKLGNITGEPRIIRKRRRLSFIEELTGVNASELKEIGASLTPTFEIQYRLMH